MAERASVLSAATSAARGATGTTDYYPIVVGAIAGLSQSSTKARRQVYERATRVLLGKLRASRPKLSRKQIRLEQRALEAAIQRVEAEAKAAQASARPVAAHYADAKGASADRRPRHWSAPRGRLRLSRLPSQSALAGARDFRADCWRASTWLERRPR